jgi:DNA polymerase (family 10)
MELARAEALALRLQEQITPYCSKVAIAGSIRRRKDTVGDLELVALPRWERRPDPQDLFGGTVLTNVLFAEWGEKGGQAPYPIRWQKGCKATGRYWQGIVGKDGPHLDLFLPAPANWGLILAIRTGCAEFSQALVTRARELGIPSDKGFLRGEAGEPLPTLEEADLFQRLRLEWIPPEARTGPEALRPLAGPVSLDLPEYLRCPACGCRTVPRVMATWELGLCFECREGAS